MNQAPKSGHAGIQYRPASGTYRARVKLRRIMHHIGEYRTLEEAVAARATFIARMIDAKRADSAQGVP